MAMPLSALVAPQLHPDVAKLAPLITPLVVAIGVAWWLLGWRAGRCLAVADDIGLSRRPGLHGSLDGVVDHLFKRRGVCSGLALGRWFRWRRRLGLAGLPPGDFLVKMLYKNQALAQALLDFLVCHSAHSKNDLAPAQLNFERTRRLRFMDIPVSRSWRLPLAAAAALHQGLSVAVHLHREDVLAGGLLRFHLRAGAGALVGGIGIVALLHRRGAVKMQADGMAEHESEGAGQGGIIGGAAQRLLELAAGRHDGLIHALLRVDVSQAGGRLGAVAVEGGDGGLGFGWQILYTHVSDLS